MNQDITVPDISKEINVLSNLRSENLHLIKELEVEVVKPDLREATEQLNEIDQLFFKLNLINNLYFILYSI